jgi:hypothetical protein
MARFWKILKNIKPVKKNKYISYQSSRLRIEGMSVPQSPDKGEPATDG